MKRKDTTKCSKCGKSNVEFHQTSRTYENDGKVKVYKYPCAKCKDCRNAEGKNYNASHKEQIREYNKNYRKRMKENNAKKTKRKKS